MPKCRQELPRMESLNGDAREVACWLHRDGANVPAELAVPSPHPDAASGVRPTHEVGR
jgi:hypothetical protein